MKTSSEIYKGLGSQLIDHQHSYPGGGIRGPTGAPVLPDKPKVEAAHPKRDHGLSIVVRMWGGGPLRNWSPIKTPTSPHRHSQGCFVGAYVCERCRESCDGIYLVREGQSWLCGGCKRGTRYRNGATRKAARQEPNSSPPRNCPPSARKALRHGSGA